MVNLSPVSCIQVTSALLRMHPKNTYNDGYWRKRQVFRLAAHFYGRSRNCFSLAIRRVQKALQYITVGRALRKRTMKEIWNERIDAGMQEHGYMPNGTQDMMEALQRSEIFLNRQSLQNLAIWEPRTFESICKIAAVKAKQENINGHQLGKLPQNIYTRGKL